MIKILRLIINFLIILLPWSLRRILLIKIYGYRISKSSYIGLSWIYPRTLTLENNSRIGNLNFCSSSLDHLYLGSNSSIGILNLIFGYSSKLDLHYGHKLERIPQLILASNAAITHFHILDCTDTITIKDYTIVAGFFSQLITHSIDLENCRQSCDPIEIGMYCFLGTNTTILPGCKLPDYSVLGAKSLLNKSFEKCYHLYGGVPAKPIKELDCNTSYFVRTQSFVK